MEVTALLQEFGIVALLLLFVIEGAMLLYIAPSESLVPVAIAVLAESTAEIAVIIGVSVIGATIGQYALFTLVKRRGRDYVMNHRWFAVSEKYVERFEHWFESWGHAVIPVSNTLPFTRGMFTVPAGFADMSGRRFIVLSAVGTLVFESVLAMLTLGVLRLF